LDVDQRHSLLLRHGLSEAELQQASQEAAELWAERHESNVMDTYGLHPDDLAAEFGERARLDGLSDVGFRNLDGGGAHDPLYDDRLDQFQDEDAQLDDFHNSRRTDLGQSWSPRRR